MQLTTFPPPKVFEYNGVFVVRDDLLPGGTKRRIGHVLMNSKPEYVYASTVFGYAQIALAYICRDAGKKLTLFVAQRKELHHRTSMAKSIGANIVQIPMGYLSNTRSQARRYFREAPRERHLVPYGLDTPEVVSAMADVARKVPDQNGLPTPKEVWVVAGSGTISRALQLAWPDARVHAVGVGASAPDVGNAVIHHSPDPFSKDAAFQPPFPTVPNYDAKAWVFVKRYSSKGAWFWNVAG